jgi:cell division protein FtsQ
VNPWHDARMLNLVANALVGLTLAACVASAVWWVSQRPAFSLRTVDVEPRPGHAIRQLPERVLQSALAQSARGNFFTVRLEDVRAVVETVPWVRRASVRRVWPAGLAVEIEEHRAFALWGEDGGVINTEGELFYANLAEAEEDGPLPRLSGPPGTESLVATRYAEIVSVLVPSGRKPVMLALSERHAWTVKLDDGTTLLLGRDREHSFEKRIARWIETYPEVQSQLNRRAALIDLRYPNGFAIRSLAMIDAPGGQESAGRAETAGARGGSDRRDRGARQGQGRTNAVGNQQ